MSLTEFRKSAAVLIAAFSISLSVPMAHGQDPNQPFPQQQAGEPPQGPQGQQGPLGPQSEAQGSQEPDEAGPNVARISLVNGDVSVRRGDSGEYVAAALNAPVMAQDYIATGPSGHAEVQFDYSNIVRLGAGTEIRFTALDANRLQLQIARGTITYRVRADSRMQVELSTPSVSVRPVRNGSYRVSVLEDGETQISVRSGEAEIATPRGVEKISAGRMIMVRGTPENPEFQIVSAPARDEWDQWNERRDQEMDRSRSYQYMSRDIQGGEDLDAHGRWISDPQYGNVWSPNVPAGWAPYRVGRWVWEDYYGWTWVSGDPWGWAPYHYGSWYNGAAGWCWYPGPAYSHHFWRPALVAFFGFGGYGGGLHVGFGFGNVGWVPLAPFERFHPWYGRGYYGGYGRGVVNNINIVNNTNISNVYRNARVGNAVSGVNAQDFANGRFHNTMGVGQDQVRQAGLVHGALPVAPTNGSLRFSDRQTQATASSFGNQSRFYSRTQPAASNRVPFQQQRQAMERSYSGQGRQFGTQGSVGGAAGVAAQQSRGYSAPQSANPAGNRGWNRFGNPGAPSGSQPAAGNSQAGQPSAARDTSAWSRFGSSGRSYGTQSGPSQSAPSQPAPAAQRSYPQASPQGGNGGWSRFGQSAPQGQSAQRNYSAPAYSSPAYSAPRSTPYANPSQSPSYRPSQYRGSQGSYSQPSSQPSRSAPLQISQPIVRERSAPQQYSRPSYSSAPAPSYSSGSNRGGGGNSSSRSSYSGGGGQSSGGGRSSNGGGHTSGGSSHGGGRNR